MLLWESSVSDSSFEILSVDEIRRGVGGWGERKRGTQDAENPQWPDTSKVDLVPTPADCLSQLP